MAFAFGDLAKPACTAGEAPGSEGVSKGVSEGVFVLTRRMQQEFIDTLAVTDADVQRIMHYEQRTPEWHEARKGRMTGSICGAVVGHNFFKKPTEVLRDLLWNTFNGNEATKWGTDHEAIAAVRYENHTEYEVEYPGLVVNRLKPWIAYSPDGIVKKTSKGERVLLEIKCPFKKKVYGRIPNYYFDQIQYGAHLMQCPVIDFFVWTPDVCKLERYAYERAYCEEFLIPTVERFYFNRFLPLYLLQQRGLLPDGTIDVPKNVKVERFWPSET
jgi:putative phage-type endonuclease